MSPTTPDERSAVVVGAGLAGLTAAFELVAAGFQVTVFEARDRVGGRTWTIREPFQYGQTAEAGGEFIDSYHADLLHYIDLFQLPLVPIGGSRRYHFGGQFIDSRDFWAHPERYGLAAEVPADWVKFERAVAAAAAQVDSPAAPWATLDPELDRHSLWHWAERLGIHPDCRRLLDLVITGDYATDPDCVSAAQYIRDEALLGPYRSRPGRHFRLAGGTDSLAQRFAEHLGDRIRLGAAVVRIEQNSAGVRVTARLADQAITVAAGHLVCAIPATTLRRIAVEPAWPTPLGDAIAGLQYGEVTKVLLQFRERLWRRPGSRARGFVATDGPVQYAWEPPQIGRTRSGILSVYSAGRRSRSITSRPPAERVELMVNSLEALWPGLAERLIGAASQAWAADPWSGGAYSVYGPGEFLRFAPHWTTPAGRIYLAGEHTSHWQAFMTGAVESGRRAARQVIERASA